MKENLFEDMLNDGPPGGPQIHHDGPPRPVNFTDVPKANFPDVPKLNYQQALDRAKEKFLLYERNIENLQITVKNFQIHNDTDAAALTRLAAEAAELAKTLEEKRKEVIKDPGGFVNSINAFVKVYREILTEPKAKTGLVEIAKQKIGEYQFQKELERRKAEKAAQEEQAKLQAKMNEEAAAAGVEAPELPAQVIPEKTAPIRTEAGSANFGTEWIHELEDITKVPWEYLLVNDAKVKASIKAGIRDIPGLIIKEVPKVGIRTR